MGDGKLVSPLYSTALLLILLFLFSELFLYLSNLNGEFPN